MVTYNLLEVYFFPLGKKKGENMTNVAKAKWIEMDIKDILSMLDNNGEQARYVLAIGTGLVLTEPEKCGASEYSVKMKLENGIEIEASTPIFLSKGENVKFLAKVESWHEHFCGIGIIDATKSVTKEKTEIFMHNPHVWEVPKFISKVCLEEKVPMKRIIGTVDDDGDVVRVFDTKMISTGQVGGGWVKAFFYSIHGQIGINLETVSE